MIHALAHIAAALTLTALAGSAMAQSFDLTGPAPGDTLSRVFGLSADGQTAAGWASGLTPQTGFFWTRDGGRQDFGRQPGMPGYSGAYGISGNGRVAVGRAAGTAFRYEDGVLRDLGRLNGFPTSALGTDNDGSVVVGRIESEFQTVGQAFRWTEATGMVGLGFTRPNHFYSEAAAVSRDGTAIVGHSRGGSGLTEPFVWTTTAGMQVLPSLPGASATGRAFGVTHDGNVIVGDSGTPRTAVVWRNGQVESLVTAPGFFFSQAVATNDAGTIIVGSMLGQVDTAMVWTTARGMEPLDQYLAFHGVSVPAGINLLKATSVSADGMTIGGYTSIPGQVREGFVATIPAPAALPGLAAILAGSYVVRRRRKN